jgi:hypothetical protein
MNKTRIEPIWNTLHRYYLIKFPDGTHDTAPDRGTVREIIRNWSNRNNRLTSIFWNGMTPAER